MTCNNRPDIEPQPEFQHLYADLVIGRRPYRLDNSFYVGRSPMRNHEVDAKGKAAGGSAANGAVSSKRRKR